MYYEFMKLDLEHEQHSQLTQINDLAQTGGRPVERMIIKRTKQFEKQMQYK